MWASYSSPYQNYGDDSNESTLRDASAIPKSTITNYQAMANVKRRLSQGSQGETSDDTRRYLLSSH